MVEKGKDKKLEICNRESDSTMGFVEFRNQKLPLIQVEKFLAVGSLPI